MQYILDIYGNYSYDLPLVTKIFQSVSAYSAALNLQAFLSIGANAGLLAPFYRQPFRQYAFVCLGYIRYTSRQAAVGIYSTV